MDLPNDDDLDEVEKEYNRLVPEYNNLIDYLKTISEKFSVLEQEFNEEQVRFFLPRIAPSICL